MHIDSESIEANTTLMSDVSVVGAGITGITIAQNLSKKGFKVNLFESGTFEKVTINDRLNAGSKNIVFHNGDQRSDPTYQQRARERFFGGGCNHWGGSCLPLSSLDFKKRPWVANSGWPIKPSDLSPYYTLVCELLEIPSWGEDSIYASKPISHKSKSPIRTILKHRSPIRGKPFYDKFKTLSNDISGLYINASAVKIVSKNKSIQRIKFASTKTQKTFYSKSKYYILALGGIETPRLLLESKDEDSLSIGNEYDNVGRYFSDHLVLTENLGGVSFFQSDEEYSLYDYPQSFEALFAINDNFQKQHRLSNTYIGLRKTANPSTFHNRNPARLAKDQNSPEITNEKDWTTRIIVSEQIPNRESRVSLDPRRKNRYGNSLAHIDWNLLEQDYTSLDKSMQIFSRAFGIESLGRVRNDFNVQSYFSSIHGGPHTLGTTRMGFNPKTSVVDNQCKIHSISNLYISGGSIFPTIGCAHPTMHVLALALRLCETISKLRH